MTNVVEVNGVEYIQKEQKQSKMSPSILTMIMMMGGSMFSSGEKTEQQEIDIIKEYGLIQQKKSNLTASQRKWVVYQFERNFIKKENKPDSTKGEYNQECYRTICSNKRAVFYNHSTKKHYCPACAKLINTYNYADAMRLYGHELCTLVATSNTKT